MRFFSPRGEVPFCGHATIALGATLGARFGPATYALALGSTRITVRAFEANGAWGAELASPPTSHAAPGRGLLGAARALFGLEAVDLSQALPPIIAHAGADHLILPLATRATLAEMAYPQAEGARLMDAAGLSTIALVHDAGGGVFHARNAFASGGVSEDPATGAAAAALGGWLRDTGRASGALTVLQGHDMGRPSRIGVKASGTRGGAVQVSGMTRKIA